MKKLNIFGRNHKYLLLIFFSILLFYFIYINKNTIYCHNILDPFYVFKKILKTTPIVLCKSKDSEHICYQNRFSFFAVHRGVICFMNNYYINPTFWKEDGYNFDKGPTNNKTRGVPLISHGFFNMKCDINNSFSSYSQIYDRYFHSWNYSNNKEKEMKGNEEELFPGKTVFLLSRNQDSPNLLIGGCQFINAFSLMHILNLNPENIQVLFLESINLNYDPYFNLYKNILSGGVDPIHIRDLNHSKIYHISKGIHVPMNWDSPCFCETTVPYCKYKTKTYSYFYNSIFKYMNISNFTDNVNYDRDIFYYPKSFKNMNLNTYKKYVTFQWRKPWPKNRKGQNRILGNGPELVETIDNFLNKHNILIRLVDTALLSIEEQISIIQKTDYLLGIHGAGMFLSIYLPKNSIVHEIKSIVKKVPNRPQIIGVLSGHKFYSDFINITIKNEDFQEKYYIDEKQLLESVVNHMKENDFF